jgi:MraZ protein
MLFGEARHSMDAKNRLFIPATQRDDLGAPFMAVPSFRDKCIKLYSMEQWNKYFADVKAKLANNGRELEKINRFYLRTAAQLTPDSQGRVLLPVGLVNHAAIAKNVVIIGCGDYAEIWSEELYQATMDEFDMADMVASLEACGL